MTTDYSKYLDQGHPLLERFKNTAPASLKHCQNVYSICESVCTELPEINKDVLRVAALYHDVGKLMAPKFFTENQDGDNPHDNLEPNISYQMITRHVSDSAALLVQYGFPIEIIQVVLQHHGTKVVEYFYNKAQKDNISANEENYRYKLQIPQSTEAVVLMIVDIIEATAKSLNSAGKLATMDRKQFVRETIQELSTDRQLDNVRHGILMTLEEIIPRELDSIFHKRIDYDEAKK